MKKSVLFLAMIATAMVSCSKDETTELNSGERISFRSDVVTRGTVPFNYGSFILGGAYYGSDNKMLMKNVTFTQVGETNSYTSDAAAYWPADGSEVTFYAYAPEYMKLGGELTVTQGLGSFSFTSSEKKLKGFDQPTHALNHSDFVTATATGSKESSASGVALTFKHQLAKIEVQAKYPSNGYFMKILGVRFCNVGSQADFDFTAESDADAWSECSNTRTYETVFTEINISKPYQPFVLDNTYRSVMNFMYWTSSMNEKGYGDWYLIPQQLENVWVPADDKLNSKGGAYIGIYAQIATDSGYNNGSRLFPAPNLEPREMYEWLAIPVPAIDWKAGMQYTYQIDFSNGFGYVDPGKNAAENDPFKPGDSILGQCPTIVVKSAVQDWDTPVNEETPGL